MSKNLAKGGGKPGPGGKPGAPQGRQAPSWLLIGLWSISFYLLIRSCQQPPNTAQQLTPEQNLQIIRDLSKKGIFEGTSNTTLTTLTKQLSDRDNAREDQVKHSKLAADDAKAQKAADDAMLFEGTLLTSDADLRAAEFRQKNGQDQVFEKFQASYQLIYPLQTKFEDTPLWKKTYTMGVVDGKQPVMTPTQFYDKSLAELSAESSRNPVYGVFPGFKLIDALVAMTGRVPGLSYWLAALILAAVVRGVIWPLTQKQLMFGRQMSQLAPMLREIKEQYKEPAVAQKKTMELYSEYGLNPFAGCWPAFIQMPLFLAIYQCMLRYRFEFQKGTFLWINEHVSKSTHGFTAPNLGQKDVPLIIIYAVSLLVSTLLTPVNDPTQVKQQRTIGVAVALMFPFFMLIGSYPVSAAFVLYWTFTNLFATAQSLRAYYLLPAPPLVKVNTAAGGVYPTARKQGWWDKMQAQMQAQFEEKQRNMEAQAQKIKDDDDASGGAGSPARPNSKNPTPPAGGKQKPKKRTQ